MGTTQQEEDMTNTTPQVENVASGTQQNEGEDLIEELERIRKGWTETKMNDAKLIEFEKKLYNFKSTHKNNPKYEKLIIHIKNKLIMDGNVKKTTDSIASVMIAFTSLVISIVSFFYQINDKLFDLKKESANCEDAAKYIIEYLFEYKKEMRIITFILVLLFLGITTIIWPSISGVFKGRVKQKNFYEICLNILED